MTFVLIALLSGLVSASNEVWETDVVVVIGGGAGADHGSNYMSGNYVSYAVVYGRIAGQNAAADILK